MNELKHAPFVLKVEKFIAGTLLAGGFGPKLLIITKIALKNDNSSKLGIKGKRLKADWSNSYLEKLLGIN